ncbi:site-2 protease family protein [Candidatus Kaiserbacteria bacterium]|nr:site-2 protease family protein [Candidatus Kaiserbacteria bacterium]
MRNQGNSSTAAAVVLAGKLGPKIVAIAVKLKSALFSVAKSGASVKAAGIAGSVGMYTYLFTWQMGLALVVFIGIHEYGHIWAMKRCGLKVKGMYFIPGFGAVAISEEKFGGAKNEAYIAIMGPVWGIVGFVFPALLLWRATGDPLWAAIASVTTFINLLNHFPINPLDGGRILKALVYSQNYARSLLISVCVSVLTCAVGLVAHLELLWYMALVGWYESASEFGIQEHVRKFLRTWSRIFVVFAAWMAAHHLWATVHLQHEWSWVWGPLSIVVVGIAALLLWVDVRQRSGWYPIAVAREAWQGLCEVARLRAKDIKPIENYERMNAVQKSFYALSYVALILLHVIVIIVIAKNPAATIGLELLK